MDTEVRIPKIKEGIVIDHITKGRALDVVKVLGLDSYAKQEHILTIGMNLSSKKQISKDVIKIENKTLTKDELDKIAIISPHATVCIIKDYEMLNKIKISIPKTIKNIIRCPNPKCITNHEKINTQFITKDETPYKLKCFFCEKTFEESEIRL